MFTIRFNLHQQPDEPKKYISYSCRSYFVKHNGYGEASIRMYFPDGEYRDEAIGAETPYDVAYVTNTESRTIDVIREIKGMKDG